jgi:hypothetical protein
VTLADAPERARTHVVRAPPSRSLLLLVFAGVALWAGLGLDARASYGARMIADEPQYVLSAISLVEDGDLDIADELAAERWRVFHEVQLPRQTEPRPNGSELSPHDPLLPVLLAPGVGLFGWVGARLTMAAVAGALASLLVWTAVVRLRVRLGVALVTVAAFSLSAPLSSYGSQVYPELVAGLAVAVASAALLGPPSSRRTVAWVTAVVALPWLGVKYAPVAAAITAAALWLELARPVISTPMRSTPGHHLVENRRRAAVAVAVLVAAGTVYLAFHQAVYGGWTVYAAGDHFVDGELTVVGHDADHLGRSVRLVGLLVDRHFGLVAWAPVYLLAVPAVAALLRPRRRPGGPVRSVLLLPLAAGWATATWVALTMHGWWWPGRQIVVVLPSVVLAVARFVDGRGRLVVATAVAGAIGAATWLWLVVETTFGGITLIVDFDRTSNPWVRAWRQLLPDQRADGFATAAREVLWVVVLAVLAVAGWRTGRSAGADEDALAGEGPDADGRSVDLDRGGAVGR